VTAQLFQLIAWYEVGQRKPPANRLLMVKGERDGRPFLMSAFVDEGQPGIWFEGSTGDPLTVAPNYWARLMSLPPFIPTAGQAA
jgi:hypothetical protein